MKKQISPAMISVIIVCVLALVGVFLYRAATDKPSYPGANVGPGGGPGLTADDYTRMLKNKNAGNVPGAVPGAGNPSAGTGGTPAPGTQTK